jgi:hypothetical protein
MTEQVPSIAQSPEKQAQAGGDLRSNYNDILTQMQLSRIEARMEAGDFHAYLIGMTKMMNTLSPKTGELLDKAGIQQRVNRSMHHFFSNLKVSRSLDSTFLDNTKSLVAPLVDAVRASGLVPVDADMLEGYFKELEERSSQPQQLTIDLEPSKELPETPLPDAPSYEISPISSPLPAPPTGPAGTPHERAYYIKNKHLISSRGGSPEDESPAQFVRRPTFSAFTTHTPGSIVSEEENFSQAEEVFSEGDEPPNSDDLIHGFRCIPSGTS